MSKGNVVSAGDLAMYDDPDAISELVTTALVRMDRCLLIQFQTEEDCRNALDAGSCEYTVFGVDKS